MTKPWVHKVTFRFRAGDIVRMRAARRGDDSEAAIGLVTGVACGIHGENMRERVDASVLWINPESGRPEGDCESLEQDWLEHAESEVEA